MTGWRHFGFLLEAMVVIPIGTLISLLPMRMGKPFGRLVGTILFHLHKGGRELACHNLEVVFSDRPLSNARKEQIVRNLFINLARSVFEFLKLDALTMENYEELIHVKTSEAKAARDCVLKLGKGVLDVSAHLGNWEYLISLSAKAGYHTAAIINRQLNPYTDKWLKGIRENQGKVICCYNDPSGLRGIVKHLKQKGIVGMLADEAASPAAVTVPFFGRETATTSGPAQLHLRYGAPLMFYFCVREPDGKYTLSFDGPYHFDRSEDFQQDCMAVMTLVNRKYETMIRRYPDQWFALLYPRWGKQPEDRCRT